jgi:adenylate cyclase, class 2
MSTDGNHEIEIKIPVRDAEALVRGLQSAGFRLKTPSTFESNTLYDNASGDLRRAGEVLRLRVYGERCTLTHKSRGVAGRHKSRVEHETVVANPEQMHAILIGLGYRPAFRYEKMRAEWCDGKGEVVLDRTPIGDLGEIEGEPDWIDRVAKLLGVTEADYITSSYADLFFRWKQRTGSQAREMTFEQCGTPQPSAE